MRIIPKKTKVHTEFFKGLSLGDVLMGLFAALIMVFVLVSNLPGKLYIEIGLLILFGCLLVRIDEDRNYVFLLDMIRHFSYRRMYKKITVEDRSEEDELAAAEAASQKDAFERLSRAEQKQWLKEHKKKRKTHKTAAPKTQKEHKISQRKLTVTKADRKAWKARVKEYRKQRNPADKALGGVTLQPAAQDELLQKHSQELPLLLAQLSELDPGRTKKLEVELRKLQRKQEDAFLKSKGIAEELKTRLRTERSQSAEAAFSRSKRLSNDRKRIDIKKLIPFTAIADNLIDYNGEYYGAVIEIPSVEFRFFSEFRQNNAIDKALGGVLRMVSDKFSANLVKLDRPVIYDEYMSIEYKKMEALKTAFVNGLFTEAELQNRLDILYSRIAYLQRISYQNKVLLPFYYLVLYEKDKRTLEMQVANALNQLRMGELDPRRLNDPEIAVFLKYSNEIDFDEREINSAAPKDYAAFAMPNTVDIRYRTTEINSIVTHNLRVISYPTTVRNAWGAELFSIPGTKVVMKMKPIDRQKAIRAIDRSIDELRSQSGDTGKSSKLIEISTHIETLSELLVLLQNDNETLMEVNVYITAYDILTTNNSKLIVDRPEYSCLPPISGMKKFIRRRLSEASMKTTDMSFQQVEAFIGSQISGYDPKADKGRDIHSSSVAAAFPFVRAYLDDKGGVNLGKSRNVPVFIDFFRRDNERINSNMVILGKSGSGKSFATKTLLANLAAENGKIFVLDPENEYAEICRNLNGKMINVGSSANERLNPFQIITGLEDDEGGTGEDGEQKVNGSFSAHLQFLEEFFRQILPDIDADAMEYLNNIINRVYDAKNIDEFTDLSTLEAEDFPTFDNLYDKVLEEFQSTKSDYLRANLRILMNYIAKFSTGGRNAALWNGPSTISTEENFIVFNFQSLLANRNNTVANAQMLLVLKWLDNEIIKNRDYNTKYNEQRKVVIVIDEAHVFIDTKYPLALDFMFQLAKRIRKYNGMQIVITQNIKDFVGSEEIARKSTAIINACQYSFIFALAPNDMHDLCKLYEKAGEINPMEQEQIINAGRGQAFVVTSPTRRTSLKVETPDDIRRLFSDRVYHSDNFSEGEGLDYWNELMTKLRARRKQAKLAQLEDEPECAPAPAMAGHTSIDILEILSEEDTPAAPAIPEEDKLLRPLMQQPVKPSANLQSPPDKTADFDAFLAEIKEYLQAELNKERTTIVAAAAAAAVAAVVPGAEAACAALAQELPSTHRTPPVSHVPAEPQPAVVANSTAWGAPLACEEAPALDEPSVFEEASVLEEIPAFEEAPTLQESPVSEDTPGPADTAAPIAPDATEERDEGDEDAEMEERELDFLSGFRAQIRSQARSILDDHQAQEAQMEQARKELQQPAADATRAARPPVREITLEELLTMKE